MTENAPTRLMAIPAEQADDLGEDVTLSPVDLLQRVWHLFISMRTGLALILAASLLGILGSLLAQAPTGLTSDPQAYAQWLASVRPRYGGWTDVLDTLGLFSIFSSVWFRGVVALLMASVIACSIHRTPVLWRQARAPQQRMSASFFDHAAMRATVTSTRAVAEAADHAASSLRHKRYRTLVVEGPDAIDVYADRFRWAPFGSIVAHLSLVLVLLGVVVGTGLGFRDNDFSVPVGSRVDVGHGTGLALEATAFRDSYDSETGAPLDYASDIVVYEGRTQVAAQTVRVNQPLRYAGLSFYQSSMGPAVTMRIADQGGATLFEGGIPLQYLSTDAMEAMGQVALPAKGLTVWVGTPASGQESQALAAGQVEVQVYRDGSDSAVDYKVLDQGQSSTVGGLTATFVRENQYTALIVVRDPGAPFVWLGAITLVLGVCLVFFFPRRRIWARVERVSDGSAIRLGALARHDVTFQSDFQHLIEGIQMDLDGDRPEGGATRVQDV